jgi:hypothetical protein
MSKKASLIAFGCFIIGVGSTYFFGMGYWSKQTANGLALIKELEIAESSQQTFAAYQHESPQVAIYALSQYLDALKKAEAIGSENPVIMTKDVINCDMMLAHARLAKVYAAAGQPELSAQHIAEALKRASQDRKLQTITSEAVLSEILTRIDKGATK